MTLVLGHRGACGYLPENTFESFSLAFEQGADAIEFDVVPTKDAQLLIRHDAELSLTTDIAARPDFESRMRTTDIAGEIATGWFSFDFEALELQQLRATERYEHRSESKLHDGKYAVSLLSDLLAEPAFFQKHLIIEIKHGDFFHELGLDPVSMLARELQIASFDPVANHQITVEAFDFETLRRAREEFQQLNLKAKFVFLVNRSGLPLDHLEMFLDTVKDNFDGLSISLDLLFEDNLLSGLRARSLTSFAYTLSLENLARSQHEQFQDYFREVIGTGVDGVFVDQPDLLAAIVRDLT